MKDASSFLDVALDDFTDFDPLNAFNEEDEEVEDIDELSAAYVGKPHDGEPDQKVDERCAEERIADLFSSMAPCRKTLLGMLSFCSTPQTTDNLDVEVARLQANNFSVYSAAALTNLLEQAGALVRVTAEGEPYPDDDPEPVLVEVDGVSYYEVAEAPVVHWVVTEEGAAYLAADKPLSRLNSLLDEDIRYASIYDTLLALCAAEEGATVTALSDAVDDDPLLENPRLYAPHFIDKLAKCDALEWRDKAWRITDIGRSGQTIVAKYLSAQDVDNSETEVIDGSDSGAVTSVVAANAADAAASAPLA